MALAFVIVCCHKKSLGFYISHSPSPRHAAQTVSPAVLPPGVFMVLVLPVFHILRRQRPKPVPLSLRLSQGEDAL